MLLVNVRQVWALTITPNPPIAGQSFTISGPTEGGDLLVFADFGCPAGGPPLVLSAPISAPTYAVTVPPQPVGHYSASAPGDPSGCVDFTVIPAPSSSVTSTVPVYVGDAFLVHKNYCTASPTHC